MTQEKTEESNILKKWRNEVLEIIPQCWCVEAYKSRGLVQPDCPWCDHAEDVAYLFHKIESLKTPFNKKITIPTKTVYLAGPIGGCTYGECTNWREGIQIELQKNGISGISPMRAKEFLNGDKKIDEHFEEYKHPIVLPKGVVTRDRWDCSRCNLVLMNLLGAKKISIGSMIEVGWADANRIPIILVMEDENIHRHIMLEEIPGFRVKSLEEALNIIKGLLL